MSSSDPAYYHLYFEPRAAAAPPSVVYRQPQTMDNRYKVALLGADNVGKAAMVELLAGTSALPSPQAIHYPSPASPPVPVEPAADAHPGGTAARRVHWQLPNKIWVKVDFVRLPDFDPLSEQSVSPLRPQLRDCSGVALVYDVADRRSFVRLEEYARALKNLVPPDCDMIFVGNKCDFASADRRVPAAEADLLAASYGSSLFEVSALSGANVKAAFVELVLKLRDKGDFTWPARGDDEVEVDAITTGGGYEEKGAARSAIGRAFCAWRCF